MKKILILLCAIMAAISARAYEFDIEYKYNGATLCFDRTDKYGECVLAAVFGVAESIVIPSSVSFEGSTYAVTRIGYEAFYQYSYPMKSLVSVEIPNSVTSIGSGAFMGCESLTSVNIPESVTEIGSGILRGTQLYNDETNWDSDVLYISNCLIEAKQSLSGAYTIKENTRLIADKAFCYCANLTSVQFPNTVTTIGESAFLNCRSLLSVSLVDSVASIGNNAFMSCSNLESFNFGNSVPSINSSVFVYCDRLESFTGRCASDDHRCIVIDGKLIKFAKFGLTSYQIPTSVTSIGESAFSGCTNLQSIDIPTSVTEIGGSAFSGCTKLQSIDIPTSVTEIGGSAFSGCTNLQSIDIPTSVTEIGRYAFNSCKSLTSITIPRSVEKMGYGASYCCQNLSFVSFNATNCQLYYDYDYDYRDNYVFESTPLTSVIIGENVEVIPSYLFKGCYKLKSLAIGSSVRSIGSSAFDGCTGLTSVQIDNDNPSSIALNGEFERVPSSCVLYVPNGRKDLYASNNQWKNFKTIAAITEGLIYDYTDETHTAYKITGHTSELPADVVTPISHLGLPVVEIGRNAFFDCSSMVSVKIGANVTSIGYRAFHYCTGLTSVEFPSCVTTIGEAAFSQCTNLKTITFDNTLSSIGTMAFQRCLALTEVTIPTSLDEIGDGAFCGCLDLRAFKGKYASDDNRSLIKDGRLVSFAPAGLSEYVIPRAVTSIGGFVFSQIPLYAAIDEITIPSSVISIGEKAFGFSSGLNRVKVDNDDPANISLADYVFYDSPNLRIYVPRGSMYLYKAAEQWNESDIYGFGPVKLIDGKEYASTMDTRNVDVNYTRTFSHTEWQPLYVPFNMSYEEWSEYADVAEVYNVRAYDTDNDEKIDDIAIEFNKLTSGEIVPNIPYVIRAKSTGTVTFECSGKTMLAAPEEEGTIECSSTKMTYSFHGIYQPKTDLYSSGVYHLSDGAFRRAKSDAAVLSPNRFYLKITPKTGGYNPSSLPNKIRMIVDGEEVTTSIEDIEIDTLSDGIYYDLTGRQVKNPTRGIYIQNGKKVIIK